MATKLKKKSITKAMMKPLLDLALIEAIRIQIGTTKSKAKTPNGYRITNKGILYLQKVSQSTDVNIVKLIRDTNLQIDNLGAEFGKILEATQKTSFGIDQVRKSLDKIGKMKIDDSSVASHSTSQLDLNLLLDTVANYTTGMVQVAPVDKVMIDIQRKTGIPIDRLKVQILRFYTQNMIELVKGRSSASQNMLIRANNGAVYSHIKVK